MVRIEDSDTPLIIIRFCCYPHYQLHSSAFYNLPHTLSLIFKWRSSWQWTAINPESSNDLAHHFITRQSIFGSDCFTKYALSSERELRVWRLRSLDKRETNRERLWLLELLTEPKKYYIHPKKSLIFSLAFISSSSRPSLTMNAEGEKSSPSPQHTGTSSSQWSVVCGQSSGAHLSWYELQHPVNNEQDQAVKNII